MITWTPRYGHVWSPHQPTHILHAGFEAIQYNCSVTTPIATITHRETQSTITMSSCPPPVGEPQRHLAGGVPAADVQPQKPRGLARGHQQGSDGQLPQIHCQ
eukprot:1061552-Pyramimonas_sp.AAC.1